MSNVRVRLLLEQFRGAPSMLDAGLTLGSRHTRPSLPPASLRTRLSPKVRGTTGNPGFRPFWEPHLRPVPSCLLARAHCKVHSRGQRLCFPVPKQCCSTSSSPSLHPRGALTQSLPGCPRPPHKAITKSEEKLSTGPASPRWISRPREICFPTLRHLPPSVVLRSLRADSRDNCSTLK